MVRLLEASGLTCDRSSLDRKLRGEQSLRSEECEALATALSTTIIWPLGIPPGPRRRVAANDNAPRRKKRAA